MITYICTIMFSTFTCNCWVTFNCVLKTMFKYGRLIRPECEKMEEALFCWILEKVKYFVDVVHIECGRIVITEQSLTWRSHYHGFYRKASQYQIMTLGIFFMFLVWRHGRWLHMVFWWLWAIISFVCSHSISSVSRAD